MSIGKGAFRVRHVAQRHRVRIQLPERNSPDAQILVTGLKDDARAAVAELELMAKLKLRPEHVLVPLHIRREEHNLVLGPEGCRAAWLAREFGVRFVRPSADGPLMLEGGVEAVARAEAHVEGLLAQRRLATVRRTDHAHRETARHGDGRPKRLAFLAPRVSDLAETGNIL